MSVEGTNTFVGTLKEIPPCAKFAALLTKSIDPDRYVPPSAYPENLDSAGAIEVPLLPFQMEISGVVVVNAS